MGGRSLGPAHTLAGKYIVLAVKEVVCGLEVRDDLLPALLCCGVLERAYDTCGGGSLQNAVAELRGEHIEAESAIEICLCETWVADGIVLDERCTGNDGVGRRDAIVDGIPDIGVGACVAVGGNPCRSHTHVVCVPHLVTHVRTDGKLVGSAHGGVITLRLITANPADRAIEREGQRLDAFGSLEVVSRISGGVLLVEEVLGARGEATAKEGGKDTGCDIFVVFHFSDLV